MRAHITGTGLRTSTNGLRRELGWTSLTDRRKIHKLQFYHKLIFNPIVPEFIKTIIPNTRQQNTTRTLRNISAQTIPLARTTSYHRSFVPSSTSLWNTLPEHLRTNNNYFTFKKHLKELITQPRPPLYYFLGTKTGNILHTKLRLNTSKLNAHLFSIQQANSPSCTCGYNSENTKHFLLSCPLYHTQRNILYNTVSPVIRTDFSTLPSSKQLDILIHGTDLSREEGRVVATAVQSFIIHTHRL